MPRLILIASLFAALIPAATAESASAKSCADYTTQADAQAGADTNDGDGDGIFCEALPCPCSAEWIAQHGNPDDRSVTGDQPNQTSKRTLYYRGRIIRVVDGDTLKVRIKKKVKTVRVIGIDTPESHKPGVALECGAKQATSAAIRWSFKRALDYNRDGLYDHGRGGRLVRLQTDNTQTKTDKYGRLLAYVTRGSSDFGRSQLWRGWASVFVYANNPFKRVDRYNASRDSARAHNRGAWKLCGGDFHSNQ